MAVELWFFSVWLSGDQAQQQTMRPFQCPESSSVPLHIVQMPAQPACSCICGLLSVAIRASSSK